MDEMRQRVRDLEEIIGKHVISDEALKGFAWLFCDGCGAKVALDRDNLVTPEGWELRGPDNDFCPHCVKEGK